MLNPNETNEQVQDIEFDPETGELLNHESALTVTTPTVATVMVNEAPQLIAPDQMPNLDEMQEGFTLAAKYIEFAQPGQSERGVFIGYTKMKNQKGEDVDLANFQNQNGVWVNAGANLVFQLKDRGVPHGTPLQVTYRGKERTKGGNDVKVFDVRLLGVTKTAPQRSGIPDMNLKPGGIEIPSRKTYTEQDFVSLVKSSGYKNSGDIVKNNLTPSGINWTAAMMELQAHLNPTNA